MPRSVVKGSAVAPNLKPSLEQRIKDLERECLRFVHERAVELAKSAGGVPAVVLESQMLSGKSAFHAALSVIETKRRDEEIADREWKKENAARQSSAA